MAWKNRIVERTTAKASDLLDHTGNWRIHPEAQKQGLVGVLDEVGIVDALTVYHSTRQGGLVVIDGHLRKSVDLEQEWPIDILDVDDLEADLVLTTKDPLAALAETSKEKLGALMQKLKSGDARVNEMLSELAEREGVFFGEDGKGELEDKGPEIDRAAELQEKWGTATGQIWQLGEHRLAVGDCTDRAVVEAVMRGKLASIIVTDPPYNVGKADWDVGVLPLLESAAGTCNQVLTSDGICFWFCATRHLPKVISATSVIPYKWMFIWYPSNNMAHGDLGFQKFTAALVLSHSKVWRKDMQDLREVPIVVQEKLGHPTPKPLPLIEYILDKAAMGGLVYDPFLGSGTTMIAAEKLGRRCFGIEIDPGYCAVAIQRWHDMTQQEPKLLEG